MTFSRCESQLEWVFGLYEIGRNTRQSKSAGVQQDVLDYVVEGFDAASGSIALVEEKGSLLLVAGSGSAEAFIGQSTKVGKGILGWVVENNEPLLLTGEVVKDPRFRFAPPSGRKSLPASSMCWPLVSDNQVIGAISLNRGPAQAPFTDEDYRRGEGIVGFISLVVDNARLYQRHQQRVTELYEMNLVLGDQKAKLKQSRDEHLASESRLKTILDVAPESIIVVDEAQRIANFNRGAEKTFGYAAAEVEGKPIDTLLPARFAARHPEYVQAFAQGAEAMRSMDVRKEVLGMRKDGSEFPAAASVSKTEFEGRLLYTVILRDLSEEKRAAELLHASQSRFRQLVETSADWIWEVDEHGVYTYASPRVSELLGYTAEEVIGKTPFDTMPADEARRLEKEFCLLCDNRQPLIALENVNLHKNGKRVVLETSGVPFFDAQGEFRGYRGIDRDITERKQAENVLKDLAKGLTRETGERFFQALVQYLSKTIDMEYVLVSRFVDDACTRARTIAVAEMGEIAANYDYTLAGTPCGEALKSDLCCLEDGVQEAFPEDDSLVERHFRGYVGSSLLDSQGRAIGMLSIFSREPLKQVAYVKSIVRIVALRAADELERQKTLEDLAREKERFSLAVAGTNDGIWDWDIISGVIYFSPRWQQMLGFDEGELDNNFATLQGLIHPDDLQIALKAWVDCLDGVTDTVSAEYRVRTKDGDYIWVHCRGVALRDEKGEPVRMAGSHSDITERRKAEDDLIREQEEQAALIEKLQEAHDQLLQSEKMASIGQLAAGVAHEINNPVGYISSNIGSLKQYVADIFGLLAVYEQAEAQLANTDVLAKISATKEQIELDYLKDDLQELLGESEEGVGRVKQIVQDLKDFSHVDEAEWQWADIHKGIDSTLNIVRNEVKYKAEVVKEYGDLPQVECIISQLNQVFMNLLVNAAHAIEEHGTITLRTGTERDGVWIEIEDTGKGMDAQTQKKIFDPFYTTKPVGQGTGLGLSLSYSIVQKHGGVITVKSEVGKGTMFSIWIPVNQQEQRA